MLTVDGRIAWVGSEDEADRYADDAAEVVDLAGALVAPAFVDAHVHVTATGLAELGVPLTDARSLAECLDRVAAYRRAHPGEPVGGQGWDETGWPEGRAPTRAELDRAAGGAVAVLDRVDGHSAVVSSAVLDLAPEVVHADGYDANGLLRRQALRLARRAVQDHALAGRRADLQRRVLRRAAALGIGAVHEIAAPHISGEQDLRALVELAAAEPLPEVVPYWGEAGDGVARAQALGARGAAGDLTLDGSIGSRSARLSEPYADDPANRGVLYHDVDEATAHIVACTRAGLQGGFHCIGDAAVEVGVTAVVRAAEECGEEEVVAARHRLDHVEMISPTLAAELGRLGVVASVQPAFDAHWGGADGMYAERLGAERAAGMNPFATLHSAGVTMAFGSDAPVTPLGGWEAVRAAVHHRVAEHSLDMPTAFAAATAGGWRAARVDDAGTLVPGAPASYAVWDVPAGLDPRTGLPDVAPGTSLPGCLRTAVRGVTVFVR